MYSDDAVSICPQCGVEQSRPPQQQLHCANCGSNEIMDGLPTGGVRSTPLIIESAAAPDALLMRFAAYGNVSARVCATCGFTQFFTDNLSALWRQFQLREKKQEDVTAPEDVKPSGDPPHDWTGN